MNWQSIPLMNKLAAIGVRKATGLALICLVVALAFELIRSVLILPHSGIGGLFALIHAVALAGLCLFLFNLYVRQ